MVQRSAALRHHSYGCFYTEHVFYAARHDPVVPLTHWGWVTHICVSKLTIIGSDNGLALSRWQAIIWTNAGILLIGPLWTNFSEILIEIRTFSFKKMHLKMSSGKWIQLISIGIFTLVGSSLVACGKLEPWVNLRCCCRWQRCLGAAPHCTKTAPCLKAP